MSDAKLTYRQEKAANLLLSGETQSDAYRGAYSTANMKIETVHRRACELFQKGNVAAWLKIEKAKALQRNHATIDEVFSFMAEVLRFDPAELFRKDGTPRSIHEIPAHVRRAMSSFEIDEKSGDLLGENLTFKKVQFNPKNPVYEMFMKHFGAYAAEKMKIEHTVPVSARLTPEETAAINKSLENKY